MRLCVVMGVLSFLCLAWAGREEVWPDPATPIYGNWQFHRTIYQGQESTIPNPQLVLQYEFLESGFNRLFWVRKNETGFCERRASFSYDGEYIDQEVTWVNPENALECHNDVDMQLGQINRARLLRVGEYLHLYIPMAGEDFIYVLRRVR